MGGYGSKINKDKIDYLLETLFQGRFSYVVTNDATIALLGAIGDLQHSGSLLIAGTGSICLTYDRCFKRVGGWGYAFGDEGSAYWIGQQFLNEFSKEADGRSKKTTLFDYIMSKYCLEEPLDIIHHIYDTGGLNRTKLASFAIDVSFLAEQGNQKCRMLLSEAGLELAQLANSSFISTSLSLYLYGGVWKAGHWLLDSFKKNLTEGIQIEQAKEDATFGAYLFAKREMENESITI